MKTITATAPESTFSPEGQPRFGVYRGIVSDSRLAPCSEALGRPGFDRWLAEKNWHFVLLCGPRWFAGLGLFQSGYLASGFTFFFDREQRLYRIDETAFGLPWLSAQDAGRPGEGACTRFRSPGLRGSILKPPGTGKYRVHVRTSGHRSSFDMALELDCRQSAVPGLSAICPIRGNGSVNLTVKQVGIPVRGRLLIDERCIELPPDHLACLDYTHGLLDSSTNWMWACGAGQTTRGKRLGLNLSAGINGAQENAIWLENKLFSVGEAHFERAAGSALEPWRIRDANGRLDLIFQPEGIREMNRSLGPFSVQHMQPVGTFSGVLRPAGATTVQVERLPGVMEEHAAHW